MRGWKARLKRTATDWLTLPPDSLLDASRVTCIDGNTVVIENVKSLLHVGETEVRVDLGTNVLRLEGDQFVVSLLTDREVHVQGKVRSITYAGSGGRGR